MIELTYNAKNDSTEPCLLESNYKFNPSSFFRRERRFQLKSKFAENFCQELRPFYLPAKSTCRDLRKQIPFLRQSPSQPGLLQIDREVVVWVNSFLIQRHYNGASLWTTKHYLHPEKWRGHSSRKMTHVYQPTPGSLPVDCHYSGIEAYLNKLRSCSIRVQSR